MFFSIKINLIYRVDIISATFNVIIYIINIVYYIKLNASEFSVISLINTYLINLSEHYIVSFCSFIHSNIQIFALLHNFIFDVIIILMKNLNMNCLT